MVCSPVRIRQRAFVLNWNIEFRRISMFVFMTCNFYRSARCQVTSPSPNLMPGCPISPRRQPTMEYLQPS